MDMLPQTEEHGQGPFRASSRAASILLGPSLEDRRPSFACRLIRCLRTRSVANHARRITNEDIEVKCTDTGGSIDLVEVIDEV